MDISAGIASLKTAIDIVKTLNEINKSYDEANYKANIIDLIEKLSDAKLALIEAKEKIFDKEKEISSIKNFSIQHKALVDGGHGYRYQANENGSPIGFPMCPKCEQLDSRLIQLVQHGKWYGAKCPACASEFNPVSCYLSTGGTVHDREIARRRESQNRRVIASRRGFS
jgi:hypothetical protein